MSGEAAPDPSARPEGADPPAPTEADQRVGRVVVVAASAVAALMVAAVLLIAVLGPHNGGGQAGATAAAPSSTPAPVFLSAGEVQGVHDALHDIDARCAPGRAVPGGVSWSVTPT